METILTYLVIISFGLILGWFISSRLQNKKQYVRVQIMPYDIFKKHMRKGQLIDIRKKDDYEASHIKGARNFSKAYLKNKKQTLIPRDQDLYLYCDNGKKSFRLARQLLTKYDKSIFVLQGGYSSLKKD
ncbi:MAG: rhodanese-like domain-containing protein [Bacillota bacterium]